MYSLKIPQHRISVLLDFKIKNLYNISKIFFNLSRYKDSYAYA